MAGGTAFHHAETGTPEATWRRTLDSLDVPDLDLADADRLVVLAAHPDDETLGAGGLLRMAYQRGIVVDVVVATDGEASHPQSRSHTAGQLARIRRYEVQEAVGLLAPQARIRHLGLPDGRLSEHEPALTTSLVDLIAEGGRRTWVVAPWLLDRHPDHEAAARAAAAACWRTDATCLAYPVWLWHWGSSGDLPVDDLVRLELAPGVRRAKTAAMAKHTSQVRALSDLPGDEVLLDQHLLAHFDRPHEFFVRALPGEPTPFDELHLRDMDPWRVWSTWYEERKRALTLAALPRARYQRAVEVGCSVGALTVALAARADEVIALDESVTAVHAAAEVVRRAGAAGVTVARAQLPEDELALAADLVVLSEVGYFLSPGRLRRLAEQVESATAAHGTVLACHWRHPVEGWPLDAARVHAILAEVLSAPRVCWVEDKDFLLSVWESVDPRPIGGTLVDGEVR